MTANDVTKQIDQVLDHRDTNRVELHYFPLLASFLSSRFPQADLSHIKIYETSSRAMCLAGLGLAAGVYVDFLKTVIFQADAATCRTPHSRFEKKLAETTTFKLHGEDVLAHEMLHAVSACMNKLTRAYQVAEEEFVYTHTIEFYYSKGMSLDHIIDAYILPFALNRLLARRSELEQAWHLLHKDELEMIFPTKENKHEFLDKYADILVPYFLERAREYCRTMIESFEKIGQSVPKHHKYNTNERFRGAFE